MSMVLNYVCVGFIFIFIMDILMGKLKDREYLSLEIDWGWFQRLICVAIWPLALLWFCIIFCKEFFGGLRK